MQYLLRLQANPLLFWEKLTEDQKSGLERLLKMLGQVILRNGEEKKQNKKLPWLEFDRHNQLAFINGVQGTGKTTLMLTLANLLNDGPFIDFDKKDIPDRTRMERLDDLVKPLRKKVIVVEPLNMGCLPPETNLLVAILSRIEKAITNYFEYNEDCRDVIRFKQFKAKVARSINGNLESRKPYLDLEQYGQAVIEQEDDRLELASDFSQVLAQLLKAEDGYVTNQSGLFLVPIDNVSSSDRCLELLHLLRTYAPQQIVYVLMGNLEHIKSNLKHSDDESQFALDRMMATYIPLALNPEKR